MKVSSFHSFQITCVFFQHHPIQILRPFWGNKQRDHFGFPYCSALPFRGLFPFNGRLGGPKVAIETLLNLPLQDTALVDQAEVNCCRGATCNFLGGGNTSGNLTYLVGGWTNPRLKNMSQNGFIFPKVRGENKKYKKCLKSPPTRWFKPWPFHPRYLEVTNNPLSSSHVNSASQKRSRSQKCHPQKTHLPAWPLEILLAPKRLEILSPEASWHSPT